MADPDDIRASLGDAAASIEPGDMETARSGVHGTLRRRRRRTRLVAAVGAGVLVAGGVVAFTSFDKSDEAVTLVGVDPTTTVASEETELEEAPTTTESDSQDISDESDATPRQPSAVETASQRGTVVASPDLGNDTGLGAQWAVPWKDGFLVGATVYQPTTLPDTLPDEIRELFPQEVVDLFPDGLPPTLHEATEILQEAGLLEVVTEILNSNTEANDAVLGAPQGPDEPPTVQAMFTTDGTTWEPVEMNLPDGMDGVDSVTSIGDRLAVMSTPSNGQPGQQSEVLIASTTDLMTWTVQEIEIPPPPIELPDYVDRFVGAHGMAANETGWVVSVDEFLDVNVEALLPADVFDPASSGGFGTSEAGVEVYLESGGREPEPLTYTWEELGVPPEVVEWIIRGQDQDGAQMWTASWDGTPVRSDLDERFGGPIIATESGFLFLAEQNLFSEDGVSWMASPLPGSVSTHDSMTFEGGAIFITNDEDGLPALYRVDSRGQSAELLNIPGLPDTLQRGGFSESNSSAIVFDANTPEINTDPLVMQADGFELTWPLNPGGAYELRDAAGEIVLSEGVEPFGDPPDEPHFVVGADGLSFTDPETGEVLVFFPNELLTAAHEELTGPPSEEYDPDFWLLATPDGERFIVDDIADGFEYGPVLTAINGDTMLVFSGVEWTRYTFS
jgi:hypothetical protein